MVANGLISVNAVISCSQPLLPSTDPDGPERGHGEARFHGAGWQRAFHCVRQRRCQAGRAGRHDVQVQVQWTGTLKINNE